jgi:hypothetical protein
MNVCTEKQAVLGVIGLIAQVWRDMGRFKRLRRVTPGDYTLTVINSDKRRPKLTLTSTPEDCRNLLLTVI